MRNIEQELSLGTSTTPTDSNANELFYRVLWPASFRDGSTKYTYVLTVGRDCQTVRPTIKTNQFSRIFTENEVDPLTGPLDGRIVAIAAAAGYST